MGLKSGCAHLKGSVIFYGASDVIANNTNIKGIKIDFFFFRSEPDLLSRFFFFLCLFVAAPNGLGGRRKQLCCRHPERMAYCFSCLGISELFQTGNN